MQSASSSHVRSPRAFTLIELLVVMAVLGMLISLLLPAVQMARESSRRAACAGNLRQLGIGLANHHGVQRAFPVGCIDRDKRRVAWSLFLLPYIEQSAAFGLYDPKETFYASANRESASIIVEIYLCPSTVRLAKGREEKRLGDLNGNGSYDPGDFLGAIDYGGMFGSATFPVYANGVLLYDEAVDLRSVSDGAAQTILVAEDAGRGDAWNGAWADGENIFDSGVGINKLQNNEIWSDHPRGAQILCCDGSAHFISEQIDAAVLAALCTRAGGETNASPE